MTRAWDPEGKPRKPRIICIGAQKAGTSWLHHQLNEHPKVWTTPFKELHYFNARHRPDDRKWLPWHFNQALQDTERRFRVRKEEMPEFIARYLVEMTSGQMFTPGWYRRAFAPAPRKMLPLDTTPEYSTLPKEGVAEAAEFLPRTKFIYLIRDPVSRAVSQLRMNLTRRKLLPNKPEGFLEHLDDPDLADRGDYASYIPRWRAHFGPDRLLILPYGRIASDPEGLMRDVEAFLGLERFDYPQLSAQFHKAAPGTPFPEKGREILRARFAEQYDFLNAHFRTDFLDALDLRSVPATPRISAPPVAAPKPQRVPPAENSRIAKWAADLHPRKPLVVGIGAQKAGTSWLFQNLGRHPGIWGSPIKEAHYFDHLFCPEDREWTGKNIRNSAENIRAFHMRNGLRVPQQLVTYLARIESEPQFTDEWYQAFFAPAPAHLLPLEITPAYSGLPPEGIDHLADYLPDTKFIYLIRDPVARMISQIRMNFSRAGRQPTRLEAWLRAAQQPAVQSRGDYATFVPRWRARFGPDRLLFLPYGQIMREPQALMARVETFLGLEAHDYFDLDRRVFSTRNAPAVPENLPAILGEQLAPQYAFLLENFDKAFNTALR